MARGLAYELRFDSEKYNHSHLIEIWEEGFLGSKTVLRMGESGLITKREREGGIYGTSMALRLESTLDSQLVKLYTSDAKKFLVRHYRNNILVQSGFIVPEQYSEEYIAAPYDVVVTVVDGLGVLKDTQFAYFGRHTILEVLKYCLDTTGLNLDFDIVCALTETGTDPTRSVLAQVEIDTEKWRERSIYDALGELTATFRAFITQFNGRWRFARYADLQEQSLIYTNSLTYLIALPNPVTVLGNTSDALFPIGSLNLSIDPAFKKAGFTRTYEKRQSFFNNPNFKLLDDWLAEGDIRSTYEGDVHYAVLEATAIGQQLSQTIVVEQSERQFLFEISFYRIGDLPTYFKVYFELQGTNNTYWLGPNGWQTSQSDFKMETASDDEGGMLDSIFSTSKDLKKGRSQQETGSIRFKTFPETGLLTIYIIAKGPTTVPDTSERSLFYVTAANLTTETERGLSVNAVLTSGNVDAPGTEIYFSDPDVGDNADRILHNYMTRLSDGSTTLNWKVGSAGAVDTFFNTMVRDYVAFYGLTKRLLTGNVMGSGLQTACCVLDKFADTYAFIDTITFDVYADQAEVTIQEIIPHLELIGITDEESIETMPRVVAYWDTLPDGTRVKKYSILAAGNTYRRLSSRTTEEMTYEELLRTRALANFTKALAALSQKKADAANLAALEASETADDAILRLNNIVSNSVVSIEEKAGLIELMERLADEMDLYAADSNNKGADLTALQSSYNALITFLNDVVDVDSGTAKELTAEQVVQYNSLFAAFYAKRSVFSTDISAIRAELLSYQTRITDIDKDKARVTAEYNALNAAEGLTSAQKETLTTAKTQYETEHTSYKTALNQIIADDKITAEERTAAGTAFTAYSTKLNAFNVAAENAKKTITDTIGTTLSNWVADGVISPLEKIAIKQTRTQITSEKEALLADADIYAIDDTNYATAWAAYDAVLVKYSADAPENIPVEDDFLTSETNYKTEKVALRTAITSAQKADTGEKHPKEGSPDLDMTVKNLVAVGSVAFYGGTGGGSTPASSLLNLSDIDSSLATAAVGSPLVKLANGKWGPGSVSIDLTNYFTKEESDARFAFKAHSHDYVAPTAFNAHTGDTTKHITSAERVAWNAKESALGNPDVDGKILASTAGGVRSWVNRYVLPVAAAAMLGGVMIGANVNVDAQGRISVAAPYSHPATHPASMIDESATRRFLTDTERANWNDSYDKRHTHGNKANLDSINQNLSQTSNVKFNDVIADGSVGFYGGVGSGSTPVASLLDLSDIDASISAAATGTPLVKLANGKWGAGSVSIDLSNYYNKSDADARYAFKSHSHDYVTTSVFNGHAHAYLPLGGGVVTGGTVFSDTFSIYIRRSDIGGYPNIVMQNLNSGGGVQTLGYITMLGDDNFGFYRADGATFRNVIHSGNIGLQSVSNAVTWNGLSIALATYVSGTVPSALIYNSSNGRVEFGTWEQYKSWLGLGSMAYEAESNYTTTTTFYNLTSALSAGYLPIWNAVSGKFQNGPLSYNGINALLNISQNSGKLIIQGLDDGTGQLILRGSADSNNYWELGRESAARGEFHIREWYNSAYYTRFVIQRGSGNFGLGYLATDTQVTNNKLAVNGSGYFNDYLSVTGQLYIQSDLSVLGPDGTDWIKVLYRNGGSPYIDNLLYLKAQSFKLGTWEIKENASGELEFIQSGVLKFKGTSAGLISQGELGFYS